MEMDKEEGEMSDDGMLVDDEIEPTSDNHTIIYKADKNGLVIEQLEKVDATKLEERAKRFGLNLTGNRVITQRQIDELYANCGIKSGNERHFRFDTIHLSCIEGLSTREIFEYLQDYKPLSLECIDDTSCNIVCQDHISVALALLVHSREIKNEELKQMIADKSSHHWREGMPHPKKDFILMRFATNGDKKMPKKKPDTKHSSEVLYNQDHDMDSIKKNPWGPLCQTWGVYDHQEFLNRKLHKDDYEDNIEEPTKPIHIKNKRLAMRLGKKRPVTIHSEDSNSDSEWRSKSKAPRMRMHADDEESKQKKQQMLDHKPTDIDVSTYAPLSIEVVNSRSNYTPRETTRLSEKFKYHNKSSFRLHKNTIRSRLGEKVVPEETWSSDEYSSDNSDHNVMSRVQKVSNKSGSNSNVWSRLESMETSKSSKSQKDLRQILRSKNNKKKSEDLRERISKTKRSGLRIEIDNNYVK